MSGLLFSGCKHCAYGDQSWWGYPGSVQQGKGMQPQFQMNGDLSLSFCWKSIVICLPLGAYAFHLFVFNFLTFWHSLSLDTGIHHWCWCTESHQLRQWSSGGPGNVCSPLKILLVCQKFFLVTSNLSPWTNFKTLHHRPLNISGVLCEAPEVIPEDSDQETPKKKSKKAAPKPKV